MNFENKTGKIGRTKAFVRAKGAGTGEDCVGAAQELEDLAARRLVDAWEVVCIELSAASVQAIYRGRIGRKKATKRAAWKKTSEAGREYLSVSIDDPSFPATVYARLIEGENGTHDLIWSRSKPQAA